MVLNLAFLRPKHKGLASGSTPGQPLLPSTFQNFVFRGKNCHSVSSVTALTKKEKTLFFFPKQWQPQSKTWQVFIGGHYFRLREVEYFKFWLMDQVEQSPMVSRSLQLDMRLPMVDSERAMSPPQCRPLTIKVWRFCSNFPYFPLLCTHSPSFCSNSLIEWSVIDSQGVRSRWVSLLARTRNVLQISLLIKAWTFKWRISKGKLLLLQASNDVGWCL